MPNAPRVRVGVVGYGAIGRHHARNLATLENVDFIGVAELAEQNRLDADAQGYSTFFSLDDLLRAGVDAVVLSLPTASHYEYAMKLIDVGCAALVELGMSSAIIQRLLRFGASCGKAALERF